MSTGFSSKNSSRSGSSTASGKAYNSSKSGCHNSSSLTYRKSDSNSSSINVKTPAQNGTINSNSSSNKSKIISNNSSNKSNHSISINSSKISSNFISHNSGKNMLWVSVPVEKNDFLSARPSWATASGSARGGSGAFPTALSPQPPLITTTTEPIIVDTDVIDLNTNPLRVTTTLQLLGSETIEYNDASSRVKLIMVKDLAGATTAGDTGRTARPSQHLLSAAAIASGGDGRRSPFAPLSAIVSARRVAKMVAKDTTADKEGEAKTTIGQTTMAAAPPPTTIFVAGNNTDTYAISAI